MTKGAAFRGQPLLMLVGLLIGWMALRIAIWQPPFETASAAMHAAEPGGNVVQTIAEAEEPVAAVPPLAPPRFDPREAILPPQLESAAPAPIQPVPMSEPLKEFGLTAQRFAAPPAPISPRAVVGHNLLLLAGLSQMEIPPALLAYLEGAQQLAPALPAAAPMLAALPPHPQASSSRWSADGWLLLREDTTSPILSGRPSYGRSQAGTVIRYRLASESALRPQAYLRASSALAGAREQEVAAGLSARLLPSVPLRFAVEARVGKTNQGTRVRPAAFAVTEFPPLELPLGVRAEAYAQGGYVGGDFATAFVDGQARVERPIVRRGELELSAGAGVWGGAQKNAARLDIGPTAAVSFRLGPKSSGARGRVAADYRFRVVGDAEPVSGPALTLSAGF